jgi:hypothetical protein
MSAYDAVSTRNTGTGTDRGGSWTHTPTNNPTVSVVFASIDPAGGVISSAAATYGGDAMTILGPYYCDGAIAYMAYKLNPKSGAQTAAVSWSSTNPAKNKEFCVTATGTGDYIGSAYHTLNATSSQDTATLNGCKAGGISIAGLSSNLYGGNCAEATGITEVAMINGTFPAIFGGYVVQTADTNQEMHWVWTSGGENWSFSLIMCAFKPIANYPKVIFS